MGLLSFVGRAAMRGGAGLFRLGASLENPNVRLDDPRAYDYLAHGKTDAGVPVNSETALTYGPWWRGINLLSDSVSKLPLAVYEHLATGGKTLAKKHEWYFPLRSKIGPWWTPADWKRLMVAWVLTEGNAYNYIDHNALELIPIDPHSVSPVLEKDDRGNSQLWYVVGFGATNANGAAVPLRRYHPDEILHFKGFSYDGLIGYSVVQKARESLGLGIGSRQYAATVFRNASRPSVVLQYPNKLPEKHKLALIAQWERMYAGNANAHRTAVLDMGVQIKDFGFSAEDSQLLETRQFQIADVANFIGVPPHKLGDRSGVGYNGLEQENLAFLGDTLEPILTRQEEEMEDKLLTEVEKRTESHEIAYDRKKLALMDSTARANYYRTALGGHGWKTPNEVREEEGDNPQPGMDTIPVPLNTGNTGGAPAPGDTPAKPSGEAFADRINAALANMSRQATEAIQRVGDVVRQSCTSDLANLGNTATAAAAYRPGVEAIFSATVLRCTRRVCHQARAAAEKGSKFPDWVDSIRQTHAAAFHGECLPVERLAGELTGRQIVNVAADWLLEGLAAGFAAIAEKENAKTLAGAVAATCERFETELPAEAVRRFLGSTTEG